MITEPSLTAAFKQVDIYLVGGAVRDNLLGLPVYDKDYVVVGAEPEQMIEWGFEQIGKDFPVFLHPVSHEEYALARTERKTGKGYHQFNFEIDKVSLEDDLLRRDLTINAIAEDDKGNLIDPYNGQQDISNRLLRHVSNAFLEDPVRLLRVARFAAKFHHLGFSVADETLELMKIMVKNKEVDALVPERVCAEMFKALDTQSPHVFFEVLKSCGALAVIFPEVDALFGVPQRAEYHPEVDTGKHLLLCLANAGKRSCSRLTKFAVLCHDLGKAKTPADLLPKHHGHEIRGEKPTKSLCKRLKVPKKYEQIAVKTAIYHSHIHRFNELKPSTIFELFKAFGVDKDLSIFTQFVDACISDAKGRLGFEDSEYPQAKNALKLAYQYQQFDYSPFVDKTLPGKEIGEAIRMAKISFIRKYKSNHSE